MASSHHYMSWKFLSQWIYFMKAICILFQSAKTINLPGFRIGMFTNLSDLDSSANTTVVVTVLMTIKSDLFVLLCASFITGTLLGMGSTNEWRWCIATFPLIDWAHAQNDYRDHSEYGSCQWERALYNTTCSHWLSPYPEWSLYRYRLLHMHNCAAGIPWKCSSDMITFDQANSWTLFTQLSQNYTNRTCKV